MVFMHVVIEICVDLNVESCWLGRVMFCGLLVG